MQFTNKEKQGLSRTQSNVKDSHVTTGINTGVPQYD
jgi:hypothetical protein